MNTKEILQKHNRWRRGDDTRTMDELGFSVTELGRAIDDAIRIIDNRDQLRAELAQERGRVRLASMVISDLDYAAYNLCENTSEEDISNVIESTCPERSLYIAIRDLKSALSAGEGATQ